METRLGTIIRWGGLKHILSRVIKEDSFVLDIGSYDGYILWKLRKQKKFTPLLLDLNTDGIQKAKERGVYSLQASGTQIPLKDNTVDVVLCLDVIEHILEDDNLISEVARVMKNEGMMVLTTPKKNYRLTHHVDMDELNKMWGHVRDGYSRKELIQLFSNHGLRVEKITSYHNLLTRYLYYYFSWRNVFNLTMEQRASILKKVALLQRWIKLGTIEHVFMVRKH